MALAGIERKNVDVPYQNMGPVVSRMNVIANMPWISFVTSNKRCDWCMCCTVPSSTCQPNVEASVPPAYICIHMRVQSPDTMQKHNRQSLAGSMPFASLPSPLLTKVMGVLALPSRRSRRSPRLGNYPRPMRVYVDSLPARISSYAAFMRRTSNSLRVLMRGRNC